MRTRERQDVSTPSQRRWLDRYALTCPTRRGFIIDTHGYMVKKINRGKRTFHYGGYSMSIDEQWEWVKKEVRNWERRERARITKEVTVNKGLNI